VLAVHYTAALDVGSIVVGSSACTRALHFFFSDFGVPLLSYCPLMSSFWHL
jgi:hypothetical protein